MLYSFFIGLSKSNTESSKELVLYCSKESLKSYLVQIAVRFSGKCLKLKNLPKDCKDIRSTIYFKDDKTELNDGNAIAFYLSQDSFKGNDVLEKSQILQWINFSDNHVLPSVQNCVVSCQKNQSFKISKDSTIIAKESLLQIMKYLNKFFLNNKFLIKQKITLADISLFIALLPAYQYVLEAKTRENYKNVNNWFESILQNSYVKSVIANFNYCEK